MVYAKGDQTGSERLRVGMVGGGRDAFIGAVHRTAMRLDGKIELLAGALSSDPLIARESGVEIGLNEDRSYGDYREMAEKEAVRDDGIEAVVIVTPNHMHAPVATAFLEAGIEVICDKPLTATLADAEGLVRLTREKDRMFLVTLNNTGYAMVRQAREMIAAGELGPLRSIHASYIQDWLTLPIDADGHKQAEWRTDPERAGASAVLADIGVHAFNLASFVTGLDAQRVAADLSTAVTGRKLDDNAHLLMRWQGDVPGTLIASQTSPGHYNDLSLQVYGERAGLEWTGLNPDILRFSVYGEETKTLTRGGHGSFGESQTVSRMPAAHLEGYIEAFGNFYRDAAEIILDFRRHGKKSDRLPLVPTVVDGAKGVKFVDAAVQSNAADGQWADARFEI